MKSNDSFSQKHRGGHNYRGKKEDIEESKQKLTSFTDEYGE